MRPKVSVETYAVGTWKIQKHSMKSEMKNDGWRTDWKLPVFLALWVSGALAPYVLLSMGWRQLEGSVFLCESHICELSPQGCSVGVPPPIRVWEGGPKRNGWWKKRFFNPSLPHPWYVKRHTSIYSCVVPRDMFCGSGLKGLQRGLNKRNNMQVSQTEG